jgi:hypothetical protein
MEERTVAAAKAAGAADVTGMIWSPYLVPMQPVIADFKKATGIGIGAVQDISIFDAPQRAMAEALSRSPQFDFIHIDSNMIPSLASAGYLEPLDEYMKKADFKIEAVADYANFMTFKGQTYGIPTDGNVHIQYVRKDLIEDPDNKKRFADKHGKELKFPQTWEEDFLIQQTLMDPTKDLYGSGSLRNRANGPTWWYMTFYSAGGFPFDDDMNSTLNTPAGQYAVDIYLQEKKVAHPESAGWGTPQMIPRIAQGHVVSCQYWDGTAKLNENPAKSKTTGKWLYGLVPGSDFSGKRIHRSISSPLAARRDPDQQVQPAQGASRLSRALARLRQEQHPDRERSREHVQRRLGKGTHDLGSGSESLQPGGHQGDRGELPGGGAANLFDRLSGVPGHARQEPVRGLCRAASGQRRAEEDRRRMERHRPPHRPRQAQGRAGELQGGDAQAQRTGMTARREESTHQPRFNPDGP